jgi:hypothetical protein
MYLAIDAGYAVYYIGSLTFECFSLQMGSFVVSDVSVDIPYLACFTVML